MSYANDDTFVLPHPFTLQKLLFCLFPTDINFSLTFQWPSLWEVTLTGADGLLWLKWVGSSLFISLPVSSDALLWSFAPQFMSFHYISFGFDGCSCTPASPQTSCLPLSASGTNEKQRITAHLQCTCNRKLPTYWRDYCPQCLSRPFMTFLHRQDSTHGANASHQVWLKNVECIQRNTFHVKIEKDEHTELKFVDGKENHR